MRLVWSLVIRQINTPDWWDLFVDALTGEVLEKFNWTVNDRELASVARRERPAGRSGEAAVASFETGCAPGGCYQVYALPKESPLNGPRTIENNPADLVASPFHWHDTNGVPGAEFTDTRGNNVEAQTDLDANDVFSAGDVRPDGGAGLIFSFLLDLNFGPETYREVSCGISMDNPQCETRLDRRFLMEGDP